jgi:DNA-binding NtrC family response regulator
MKSSANEVKRLLVVSRDSSILRPLWLIGESNGWQLEIAADPWEAIDRAQSGEVLDLLLLDFPQGSADALQSLRWLRQLRPALPIILIGHPDDHGRKQESIRMGARDYLIRPIDERYFEITIQRNLCAAGEEIDADISSDDVEPISNESFFIGVSPVMRKLRAQTALLAEANVPVLILGEDGSGKETTARLLHTLSVRSGFEFAKVNCAALPGDLLEKELFGCERKGINPSVRAKAGKLELCANGTVFLDNITEMPPTLQMKLLAVLQNRQFIRPGSSTVVEVDVRVVAASSIHVDRAISEHKLCEELYRHLSAYTVHVPSLRDRKEELSFLSRHFMHRLAKHYGLAPRELSPAIIEAWRAYNWPGNLRELEHCVKRYLMVGDEALAFETAQAGAESEVQRTASVRMRSLKQAAPVVGQVRPGVSETRSLRSLIQTVKAEAEKNAIAVALEKTGWNRKAAARLLKVSYRTVLYKIEQYKIVAAGSSELPRAWWIAENEDGLNGSGKARIPDREAGLLKITDRGNYES